MNSYLVSSHWTPWLETCALYTAVKNAPNFGIYYSIYYCFSKHAAVGIVAPLDKQNCNTDKFENELDPPKKNQVLPRNGKTFDLTRFWFDTLQLPCHRTVCLPWYRLHRLHRSLLTHLRSQQYSMEKQVTVKIQSLDGNVYLSRLKLPIVQQVSTFQPTLHDTIKFKEVLSSVLDAQWNASNDENSRGVCMLPLVQAAFTLLNLKVSKILLSNHTLMQGMKMLAEPKGLFELPDDLQEIKGDIHELQVFSTALTTIPSWFCGLSNLQVLVLNGSSGTGRSTAQFGINKALRKLPLDFWMLTQLKHFTLMNFPNLIITSDAIFKLLSLESMNISTCVSMDLNCPEILHVCKRNTSQMSCLTSLTLNNTALSGGLSLRTRNFENMRELTLRWHPNLTYFPFSCESLGLQTLRLQYVALLRLPVEMCHLTVLTNLEIANCSGIEIHSNISVLASLKILTLRYLPSFNNIPNTIETLTNLQELKIERCKLTSIPREICRLTNLTSLHLLHVLVEDVPESIGSLVQMRTIHCSIPVTLNSDSHNLLKMVVNSLPMLVQLRQLLLLSPNQDDIEHMGNLLRAWPLPHVDTTHWRFDFSKQWHLFDLPREAVRWNDHKIVRYWILQQQNVLAFLCGQHKRLGLTSVVAILNPVTIFLIVDEICRYSMATKTRVPVANF